MMFADDITFSSGGIAVITTLLATVAGATAVIFKLLMASKEALIQELREQRDSFKKVADRAVTTLEAEAERVQTIRGEVPIPKLAPVIPEHNSPTTERQQVAAEFDTLNARQIAAKLVLEGPSVDLGAMKILPTPIRVIVVPDVPVPVTVVPTPNEEEKP